MQRSATERLLRKDRAITMAAMLAMFGLAAIYTLLGIGMPMSAFEMTTSPGMSSMPGMLPAWTPGYIVLIFLMWWIMMIAMMVPSAAPAVLMFAALTRATAQTDHASRLATIFLGGYLTIWAIFSALATAMQGTLVWAGLISPNMALTSGLLSGILLVGAGVYQLTPLKQVCLDHCRSPLEFLIRRRPSDATGVFVTGLQHGAYCLGCCWYLMMLLFVGGIMNLYWIVGIAAFVAVEKLTPIGGLISRAAGVVAISVGAWLLYRTQYGFAG